MAPEWKIVVGVLFLLSASAASTPGQSGAVEFTAHITPASGVAEPVRGLPFYLLRKSYEGIRKEAETAEPPADLDKFIDGLDVSAPLKDWMKRNHSVSLAGEDFIKKLKTRDIMDVPEFYDAYLQRNAGDRSVDFPVAKYSEKERQKNPEKYEKQKQEYRVAVERHLIANPQSADGIDLELAPLDPTHKWEEVNARRVPIIRRKILELAGSKYMAGRTETDLEGRGSFSGLAAGEYWVTTLDIYAAAGDAQVRWDAQVTVWAGEVTHAELTNFNGIEPQRDKK